MPGIVPGTGRPGYQQLRDYLFLLVGLGGIVYEAGFHQGDPRWPLLVVYLTLLGLPAALGLDALADRVSGRITPPDPGPSSPPGPSPSPPSLPSPPSSPPGSPAPPGPAT